MLRPYLDERQRRLLLAVEAAELVVAGLRQLPWRPGCIRTPWPRGFGSWRAVLSPQGGCGRRAVAASGPVRPTRGCRRR